MAYADYNKIIELEPGVTYASRQVQVMESSKEGYVLLAVHKELRASTRIENAIVRLNPDERAELILALLEAP